MFSRVASLSFFFILTVPILAIALPVEVTEIKDVLAVKPPLASAATASIPVIGPIISSLGSTVEGLFGGLLPSVDSPSAHVPRGIPTPGGLSIPIPVITKPVHLLTPSLPTGGLPANILPSL